MIENVRKYLMMRYGHLGVEETADHLLIGKALHIAPKAWLHAFHKPLTNVEIEILEKGLGKSLPKEFAKMLKETNGLYFFTGTLDVLGYRQSASRDPNVRLPFSIFTSNISERPKNAGDNLIFIAVYDYDLSRVYIDRNSSRIGCCNRYDASIIYCEWDSLEDFLNSEMERLCKLHSDDGLYIGGDLANTVPGTNYIDSGKSSKALGWLGNLRFPKSKN